MEGTQDGERRSTRPYSLAQTLRPEASHGVSRLILATLTSAGFLCLLLAGCGNEASTPSASTLSQETQPRTAPEALAPLPPELVATWSTSTWLDQSGSHQIVRTYVFSPDGRYEYTLAECRSSTDCSLVSQESGLAQAANGTLSLQPQTESDDGPRAWPYAVVQDPNVGDIQLHFTLPDGQVDIFYLG
jgi:hypothetical protein